MHLHRTGRHFTGAGVNQLADIVGRVRAAVRQMTHFARHDGKTFALLARPRGFHGGVKRQDVSLKGDIVNQRRDGADTLRAVGDFVHRVDHGFHRLTAKTRRVARLAGEFIGRRRGGGVVLHRRSHLIHGGDRLLHIHHCLAGTFVKIVIAARQRLAAAAHAADLP